MQASVTFNSLQFERPKPLRQQIEDKARELLLSDKFVPGEKIPSTKELAENWGTNVGTVHTALTALEKEGFLVRYPGKGTYIAQREKKLTCIGVYCESDIKQAPYVHAVREMLRDELHENGIEMDLWMDPRPRNQYAEPWKPLIKAAEQRRFQAFIAVETEPALLQWQNKLPVPTAFHGAGPSLQNNVNYDLSHFVELGLKELARQGCRSVGLIAPVLLSRQPGDSKGHAGLFDVLESFTNVASDLGLIVKNDWMSVVVNPIDLEIKAQERFGYNQFLKLWSHPEKPEGLLVFSDVIARGVIMAIQKEQVRVPQDLKLALHKNETIDLFCPMPATFVTASERAAARALIEQVQKQFRGESCERISLPFKIEAHDNP